MRKTFILKKSFSAHYMPGTKAMIWPAKKMPKKSKKTFVKKNKIFSAELGTLLKKYKMHNLFFVKKNTAIQSLLFQLKTTPFVCLKPIQSHLTNASVQHHELSPSFFDIKSYVDNDKYFIANKVQSMNIYNPNNPTKTKFLFFNENLKSKKTRFYAKNISNIYLKNFWFLKNAALVPGIHKIRKAKTFSLVQKNSHKILRFWLGKVCFNKICKYLHKTNISFGFRKQLLFITAIESLPSVLYQKTFLFKNVFMVLTLYKMKKMNVNGFLIHVQWNALKPADVFHINDLYTITNNNLNMGKPIF